MHIPSTSEEGSNPQFKIKNTNSHNNIPSNSKSKSTQIFSQNMKNGRDVTLANLESKGTTFTNLSSKRAKVNDPIPTKGPTLTPSDFVGARTYHVLQLPLKAPTHGCHVILTQNVEKLSTTNAIG